MTSWLPKDKSPAINVNSSRPRTSHQNSMSNSISNRTCATARLFLTWTVRSGCQDGCWPCQAAMNARLPSIASKPEYHRTAQSERIYGPWILFSPEQPGFNATFASDRAGETFVSMLRLAEVQKPPGVSRNGGQPPKRGGAAMFETGTFWTIVG